MACVADLHALPFVDIACAVAPCAAPESPPGYAGDAAALAGTLERLGIAGACPSSAISWFYGVAEGNRQLLDQLQPFPALQPAWMVAPHHTGEMPPPGDLLVQMARAGVRLAKIPVHETNFYTTVLDLDLYGGLLDALAERRVPLLLDFLTFNHDDAIAVRTVLSRWPALPVLLKFPKMANEERVLYALWERFDNLHVVLSGYQLLGGIEKAVCRFGPRAFVFGSNYPVFTPLQSMLHLIYCDLPAEDKRLIAGDTARALMAKANLEVTA